MGNIDSRPVCSTHERFATIRASDSNIAHRTSDFEFFSKLLDLLGNLIRRAGFAAQLVAEQSIFLESFIIYELRVR